MSIGISSSDFVGQWSLSFADIEFINSKPAATKLGLAAQLKFFNARGFFADNDTLIPNNAGEYLAVQIGVRADTLSGYDFGGRSARRDCAEIFLTSASSSAAFRSRAFSGRGSESVQESG
ncbi:DUF4158 domain-containing protein [Martelella mediterranea]|uniref:Uncharacterized protein DUF4158 n=1 Tax=Martelella mediterranea TaxID=293089 RepID=A0A4R3NMH2_9HYPH|nr:DUF4158 domain-containing protein [Martelella mediterranea]TCT31777.1 uncharacterized protein DUF4158 [Martelella mediterranea]